MDTPSYDVIVIGAGPAGLTAATEAARAGLKALCLDKLAPGGALINLGALHDFEETSDGPDMASQLTDDATEAGVEIGFGEVVRLSGTGPWTIETAEGEKPHRPRGRDRDRPRQGPARPARRGRLRRPRHLALRPSATARSMPACRSSSPGAGGWAPHEAKELEAFASEVTVIDTVAATLPDGVQPHGRPHRRRWRAATACSRSRSRAAARGRPFRPARCSSMSASLPLRNSCRIRLHATPQGISWSMQRAAPRHRRRSPQATCGPAHAIIWPTPSPTASVRRRPSWRPSKKS